MKTILVVDDDVMNLRVAEFILKQHGYHIVKTESGMECLEYLKNNRPDLILLDVEMPIMTGIQTLEIIRSNEMMADIPVMLLTASIDNETVEKARRLNVLEYVGKPFFPQDLLERIARVLW